VRFIIRLIINAIALWVAATFVPGIAYRGDILNLLLIALVFGVLNALIRPLLSLLTCPLQILTLGLFTLVLNAVMLLLTSSVGQSLGIPFSVEGFVPALIGAIVVSIVSIILSIFIREPRG
jgi:putative membrane protein